LRRAALVTLLLLAGTAPHVFGQEPLRRDFLEDRGFLIAKATTLPRGTGYVTTTIGSDAYSATGLVGMGSSTSVLESDFSGEMLLQFEGEARILRDLRLIVETLYLGEGSETLGRAGVRLLGSRGALEVGIATGDGWIGKYTSVGGRSLVTLSSYLPTG
jgi:hypothetical protein